jgi:mannosyltransferase
VNTSLSRAAAIREVLIPGWLRARSANLVAVSVCVASGALGALGLGVKGLWHDEAFSDAIARLDFPTMWRAITHGEAFNGLYYLVLHVWVRGGHSEVWLRIPSVVFGLLAAYALFVLNRRLFGLTTALIAAVLLALNSFFIQYEQEARPYSLALFLVVLSTYLFVVALDQPSIWRWLGYGAVCAIAIYAHLFCGYIVMAHVLSLTFRRPRPRLRHVAAGYALTALLVAPLLIVAERSGILQRAFVERPDLGSLSWLFLYLTGAGGVATGGGRVLVLSYFAACCVALVFMARRAGDRQPHRSGGGGRTWSFGLMLLWLGVPILVSFVVSIVLTPVFFPRYLIVGLPALVTIAAIGISSLSRRSWQVVAVAVLIALSIPPLLRYYGADFKEGEDWKGAVAYVAAGERPDDGIVFLSRYGRRPFEYYRERLENMADLRPIYPGVAWGEYAPVLADLHIEPTLTAAARLQDYQRVWVVLLWRGFETVHEDGEPFRAALENGFREVEGRSFGAELEVRLYQRI